MGRLWKVAAGMVVAVAIVTFVWTPRGPEIPELKEVPLEFSREDIIRALLSDPDIPARFRMGLGWEQGGLKKFSGDSSKK